MQNTVTLGLTTFGLLAKLLLLAAFALLNNHRNQIREINRHSDDYRNHHIHHGCGTSGAEIKHRNSLFLSLMVRA